MSIRSRALLAVGLLVGFYLLALGMAAGLLWIPYAEWQYADRLHIKIVLFCVAGAFLILKGIFPQPDRFVPPGPRITAREHPRLFAMIDDVAKATGQAPPEEVYLVGDVNAWVTQRGGFMGYGSKRVMGIGLPLMELLTEEELRAVIAHEFGHYVGGDTKLGPWIYRTRVAIGRTLEAVGEHSGILAKPFEWYGTAFLRITHAVSRAQEYVADATASRVAGRDAMKRALVRIAGGAPAYDGFFRTELVPSLSRGYRPPLVVGFRQYLVAPEVAPVVAAVIDQELATAETDPYDTHPSLRDRLAAIERLPGAATTRRRVTPTDDAPAPGLLGDVDRAEATLLKWMTEEKIPTLTPLSWNDVPATVLPMGWRETVEPARARLAGITPESLPTLARDPKQLAVRLGLAPSVGHVQGDQPEYAMAIVGSALALVLLRRAQASGGRVRLEAAPGYPVSFHADGAELRPFVVQEGLASGALTPQLWAQQCATFGIAGADLGAEVEAELRASPGKAVQLEEKV